MLVCRTQGGWERHWLSMLELLMFSRESDQMKCSLSSQFPPSIKLLTFLSKNVLFYLSSSEPEERKQIYLSLE